MNFFQRRRIKRGRPSDKDIMGLLELLSELMKVLPPRGSSKELFSVAGKLAKLYTLLYDSGEEAETADTGESVRARLSEFIADYRRMLCGLADPMFVQARIGLLQFLVLVKGRGEYPEVEAIWDAQAPDGER